MKLFIIIALILSASLLVCAQDKQSALTEMVQTEQAFSKTAEVKTTRDAFMEFIADDGLLFRPGAVNGKKWMWDHPVPASSKRGLLAWQPTFAGMAASGDFGFTTGPWEAKSDINDEKPSAFGHFITVWKKQPDGSWKFAVDLGIAHPASGGSQTILMPTEVTTIGAVTLVDVEAERKLLLADDRKLAKESKKGSAAFFARAESGVRVYRTYYLPQIGKQAAEKILIPANSQMKWEPLDSDVAKSGDVGYTRGTYDVLDAKKKVVEHGSYVRIWRKHGPSWKIVIDVTNAH
jgi:ketosteroid isomerase-like protein